MEVGGGGDIGACLANFHLLYPISIAKYQVNSHTGEATLFVLIFARL